MSREMRLYLACTAVTFGGLAIGVLWAHSNWYINLVHLIIGSVILGYVLGGVCIGVMTRGMRRNE